MLSNSQYFVLNKILTSIKGRNAVANLQKKQKQTLNNPSEDIIGHDNAYTIW